MPDPSNFGKNRAIFHCYDLASAKFLPVHDSIQKKISIMSTSQQDPVDRSLSLILSQIQYVLIFYIETCNIFLLISH